MFSLFKKNLPEDAQVKELDDVYKRFQKDLDERKDYINLGSTDHYRIALEHFAGNLRELQEKGVNLDNRNVINAAHVDMPQVLEVTNISLADLQGSNNTKISEHNRRSQENVDNRGNLIKQLIKDNDVVLQKREALSKLREENATLTDVLRVLPKNLTANIAALK